MNASQQGDEDAFALLVQRHQRCIFNSSLRMLQDYEDASEVTQEAFLAAWQGLPSFRGEARFATWLSRITSQCCVRQLERRMRHSALQEEQIMDGMYNGKQTEEILEQRDRQARVREQMEQLPTRYRMGLTLRHLQEMAYEEMADILSMPIGTIKTHLLRPGIC